MRKMFLLFGMLAMAGFLFVACSDQQDLTSPEEAAFGKAPPANCDLSDAELIRPAIEALFSGKKDVKAANEMFTNIERKVCKENFVGATNTAFDFYVMTYGQLPDKLAGATPYEDAAALVSMVFAFASNGTAPDVPPAALQPTGGVGIVMPGANDTIWTNNDEAAFIADPGSFTGTDPVVVVMQRLADPTGFGFPIPGYQAFPEAYDFSASADLNPAVGAEFWMCVDLSKLGEVDFFDLVIGHAKADGSGETLSPPLYQEIDGDVISCANPSPPPPTGLVITGLPGYLNFAGHLLEPIADRLLDVKPLNAMYFAGKGLGGRGGALSPFAPVDAGAPALYTFSCGVSGGSGSVSANGQNTCSADSGIDISNGTGWASAGAALTQFAAGTVATVTASPAAGYEPIEFIGCESGDGIESPCLVTMDGDRSVSVSFGIVATDYTLALGGEGTGNYGGQILGYVNPAPGGPSTTPFTCTIGSEVAPCTAQTLPAGTYVRLTASPDGASTFHGWGDDCSAATGTDCWLWILEDKSAIATFSEVLAGGYALDLDVGPNGSATTSRGDGPCGPSESCTYSYETFDPGEIFTITATPDVGYVATWDANCTAPARNSCTLTPAAAMSAHLDFELQQVSLTITPNGGLGGTVTSGDGFISCSIPTGDGTCSYVYDYGTEVTLTATPDGTHVGRVFGYTLPWSCDGQTCTVTLIMDGNKGDLWGWYLF